MSQYLRPNIRAMTGYTPGEQPQGAGVIKLNTNENPYPPSPRALEAMAEILRSDRLRRYPDPLGTAFRKTAGRLFDIDPDGVLIGNGSDDILTILTRAFVPEGGLIVSPSPSYVLYSTLADIQGAKIEYVPYAQDWQLAAPWPRRDANLTLVANPNSPTGTMVGNAALETLARELHGPLVIDEAYVDFADTNALALIHMPNVLVTRTLSKSYALAGLRFGFALAAPEVVRELTKVKDSYNCDVLSLAGAQAALEDQEYLQRTRARTIMTRSRMTLALRTLGFDVPASQANFVWATRIDRPVHGVFEELKRRNILVRYMKYPGHGDGLRISVGSDAEVDRLLEELKKLV
ncbi:MAG: histidinol-phosphate transaminase [Planctomycetes bacterium]|nr:histidinol-phosphate transaminase [Planctomycetota bacterium]